MPDCRSLQVAGKDSGRGSSAIRGNPITPPPVPARLAATTIDAQLKFLCDSRRMIAMHRSWGKIVIGGLIAVVVLGGALWGSRGVWSTPKKNPPALFEL